MSKHSRYLKHLVDRGAQERYDVVPHDRIQHELDTINAAGYPTYFLIVADLMDHCRNSDIPVGPGRGSVCGSVVAYSLYITDVEPITYDIPFERFLHLDRVAMPDIDIDLCQAKRGDAIQYLRDAYGSGSVAQIITYGTMQARGVVKDVFRGLHVQDVVTGKAGNQMGEDVAAMIPEGSGADQIKLIVFVDTVEGEPFKTEVDRIDKIYCKKMDIPAGYLWTKIFQLESHLRHGSVHAAGVVIGNGDLIEQMFPLSKKKKKGEPQVQYDMRDAEDVGLLKLDVLGLRTITVLGEAEKLIQEHDPDFIIKDVPLDDQKTYELLQRGDTKGVFQLEGEQMTAALMGLEPDNFEDIIALLALFRPGPMEQLGSFVRRKKGEEDVDSIHPGLDAILERTYGLIVYQEQVMAIARTLAGYSPGEGDMFRKAIGKKLPELIATEIAKFTDRAVERGHDKEVVEEIGSQIAYFGRYGFNRGHATGYGFITYWTAYLKANFPYEFFTATLNSFIGKTDRISLFVRDAAKHGISINCPDINSSSRGFSCVRGSVIRFGLSAIKGVGEANVRDILAERSETKKYEYKRVPEQRTKPDGTGYTAQIKTTRWVDNIPRDFDDFSDFCARLTGVPINVKKALIESGAFDGDDGIEGRAILHLWSEGLNKEVKKKNPGTPPEPVGVAPSELEMLRLERQALGFYVSRHPLEIYRRELELYNVTLDGEFEKLPASITTAGIVMEVKPHTAKNGEMAWVTIECGIANLPDLTIFNSVWRKHTALKKDDVVIVKGVRTKHPKFGLGYRVDDLTIFNRKVAHVKTMLISVEDPDIDEMEYLRGQFVKNGARVFVAANVGGDRLALIKTSGYIVPTGSTLTKLQERGHQIRLGFRTSDDVPFNGSVCQQSDSMHKGSGRKRRAVWELPEAKIIVRMLGGKVVAEYERT